jgi:hypothetical protein
MYLVHVCQKNNSSEEGPEICLFEHFISPTLNSPATPTCTLVLTFYTYTHTPHSSQRSTSQPNDPMTTKKDDKTLEQKTSKQQKWSQFTHATNKPFP